MTSGGPVSSSPSRISIVTGGIPHYRWPFFEELVAHGVTLNVISAGVLPPGILETPSPSDRIHLTRLPSRGPRWRRDVVDALADADPQVIVLEHGSSLDYVWTTLLSRRPVAPRVLWTHGIARQELYGGRRGLASWGRWTQLALADGIACYDAAMARRMAARFPNKVIGVAPNSIDGRPLVEERARCELAGRAAVRARLGLTAQLYLAGLGRLVTEKDFSRLLRVGARLRAGGTDVGVVLIGSGPAEQALRDEAAQLGMRVGRDVVFAGGVTEGGALARWLYACDACVSPGFLGLSVVDCLFAGIPVLSYEPTVEGPHHSPEWCYLQPGITGFFAQEYTDDALAEVCRRYLELPQQHREGIRHDCALFAELNLGVHKMALGMLGVVLRARRRGAAPPSGRSSPPQRV